MAFPNGSPCPRSYAPQQKTFYMSHPTCKPEEEASKAIMTGHGGQHHDSVAVPTEARGWCGKETGVSGNNSAKVEPEQKKSKGGRSKGPDPFQDPNIDYRTARRIMANRYSAAKSKEKQKASNKVRNDQRADLKEQLAVQLQKLSHLCREQHMMHQRMMRYAAAH